MRLELINENDFSKLFKQLKKEQKSRTSELSLLTGLNERSIYNIEKGETDLRLSTLIKLCGAMGLKVVIESKDTKTLKGYR